MIYKAWHGLCLCGEAGGFPPEAVPAEEPFCPLVFLVKRDGLRSRGLSAISRLEELYEPEGANCLRPCATYLPEDVPAALAALVEENGATVLNTAFDRAFPLLLRWTQQRNRGFRVTVVGLGDVGGTLLTGLVLLGREIEEIAIYDPNEALCARYEMEMNQILSPENDAPPRVRVVGKDALFDCDLLAFTASRGVPGPDCGPGDVRMAQWEANRALIAPYARQARETGFQGIFCQIADPVDLLAREVFLLSNRVTDGKTDFAGLLPEQVQGFGLGVMAARAAYFARMEGRSFDHGRVYGPHGGGVIVANHWGEEYDPAVSTRLTGLTRDANLRVRELGFKPYLAPGLSSAAISLVRMLRGQEYYGSVPLGGVYFGCRSRRTSSGPLLLREEIAPPLMSRLEDTYARLREAEGL